MRAGRSRNFNPGQTSRASLEPLLCHCGPAVLRPQPYSTLGRGMCSVNGEPVVLEVEYCSSEAEAHPASHLLESDATHWRASSAVATIHLSLNPPSAISAIVISNAGCAELGCVAMGRGSAAGSYLGGAAPRQNFRALGDAVQLLPPFTPTLVLSLARTSTPTLTPYPNPNPNPNPGPAPASLHALVADGPDGLPRRPRRGPPEHGRYHLSLSLRPRLRLSLTLTLTLTRSPPLSRGRISSSSCEACRRTAPASATCRPCALSKPSWRTLGPADSLEAAFSARACLRLSSAQQSSYCCRSLTRTLTLTLTRPRCSRGVPSAWSRWGAARG